MRFNETRTSEDYGYNLAADLLCDNEAERTAAVGEVVVNVCGRPGSITSAAGRNFEWDQRVCGFVDNTIWAVDLARRHRPDSDQVTRSILHALLVVYVKLCCIQAQAPWYAEQAMEYAKKFYHLCYRRWYVPVFASMESKLGPEPTGAIIRAFAGQDYLTPPADFEPELGFDEFMGILRTEEYDPDRIYDVWERMSESPECVPRLPSQQFVVQCHAFPQSTMSASAPRTERCAKGIVLARGNHAFDTPNPKQSVKGNVSGPGNVAFCTPNPIRCVEGTVLAAGNLVFGTQNTESWCARGTGALAHPDCSRATGRKCHTLATQSWAEHGILVQNRALPTSNMPGSTPRVHTELAPMDTHPDNTELGGTRNGVSKSGTSTRENSD